MCGAGVVDLQFIVPGAAVMRAEGVPEKSPVDTLYWMREAELKHGRIAQLAGQSYHRFRRVSFAVSWAPHLAAVILHHSFVFRAQNMTDTS